MARSPETIQQVLDDLVQPITRGRLLARGLARGMVWRDGKVPIDGPAFVETLTADLLDFGYGVLALALELRDANRDTAPEVPFRTTDALLVAAESIESAVRRGASTDIDQGRHLVVSAAAFHLAGYAARSYSLLPRDTLTKNLASPERALGLLLRRDLLLLRDHIIQWLDNTEMSDSRIAERLEDPDDSLSGDDAVFIALSKMYHRGLGLADTAFAVGSEATFESAFRMIEETLRLSTSAGNIPMWWIATLTRHLLQDLWTQSLQQVLPPTSTPPFPDEWSTLRRDFIELLSARRPPHIDLWPSQIASAKRSLDPHDDLVIALPTSAGKTRIAELCILRCLADGKRAIYITPLRALSAQAERVLGRTFVPIGATVTALYGASGATLVDVKTLSGASIVVSTPEKLDFAIRQDPAILDDVGLIVFDEGHMIGLGSRELRYEVLIQRLLKRPDAAGRRIVCLSAMFNPDDPHFKDFGNWLRRDAVGELVHVKWRPTRQKLATLDWTGTAATLSFIDDEKPFVPRFLEAKPAQKRRQKPFPADDLEFCACAADTFANDGHSILVYAPQRNQVETLARTFQRVSKQGYLPNITPPATEHLAIALAIGREWLGEEHPAMLALTVGVGIHHGTLPRPFLNAIERLLDAKHLSVIVASPTLAQGIDLSCSVLLFRSLERYEGGQWVPITPAEFGNVVGRAGRAYVDLDGIAVVPSFDAKSRKKRHRQLMELARDAKGQQLKSGLAQLIEKVAELLCSAIGCGAEEFLEYVLNHRELWDRVSVPPDEGVTEDDEDADQKTFDGYLADLDVAIFSLIDDLDAPVDNLAVVLDGVLSDSLWQRTLAHEDPFDHDIQRSLLASRAQWLWSTTTEPQRRACFNSGLGRNPGVFLYDNLDALAGILATFSSAVANLDVDGAASAAVDFASMLAPQTFFSVRRIPDDWSDVLKKWIGGVPLCEILSGRGTRQCQDAQTYIQEGVVFKLVWAAEAVRVQAIAAMHAQSDALGDGPAFALTYGVPSVSAALLSQIGFSSRSGSTWVATTLRPTFTDLEGLSLWLNENANQLAEREFWQTEDQYLLWRDVSSPSKGEYPRHWNRQEYVTKVKWIDRPRRSGTCVRVVGGFGRAGTVCADDLQRLGTVDLPFDPNGAVLKGTVVSKGMLKIDYFGP